MKRFKLQKKIPALIAALCTFAFFAPAAFAAEYFPVVIAGKLIGAFSGSGEWHDAPESVAVGGTAVSSIAGRRMG